MTIYYAAASGCFYETAISSNIPADAIEISAEEHARLIHGELMGQRIVPDDHGRPTLQAPPKTTAAEVWTSIKIERDRRKAGGFKVGTLWFHSDADSRIQYFGLKDKARDLIAAGGSMTDNLTILGQAVRWKTMDGSFANVTAQLAFSIVTAAGDLDARLFAVAETHRATMEAEADPAAYDFSTGWPETFGG